ncbi:MAG: hypothetical protein H6744_21570 [Deltaproteobacteria bacterium]|nr:hypothetical protein [Deltaproteobacteria bacterium]
MKMWTRVAATGLLMVAVSACDDGGGPPEPLQMRVNALTGGSCGNPDQSDPQVDPLADLSQVTVRVREFDAEAGSFKTLVQETRSVASGGFTITNVPETIANGHELVLAGKGAQSTWYAADPNVIVRRNQDNPLELLLTKYGGFSCVRLDAPVANPQGAINFPNVMFPAAVQLGDGRILITGGFTNTTTDNGRTFLGNASSSAFLFNPRTGEVRAAGGGTMGQGLGRAAHAMEYLPAEDPATGHDHVLIVGGADRLEIVGGAFPYQYDKADGRRDYVLYDVQDDTFTPGTELMDLKRAFPRTHVMADGTVVITGGGEWPLETSQDYLQVEVFDPNRDGGPGFIDVTHFASFFQRSGHSLTFIKNTEDGLTNLLVWGGTFTQVAGQKIAEVLKQSAQQREGLGIDGTFEEVRIANIIGVPNPKAEDLPFTFHHEMTPLGNRRFLLTGGARVDCSTASKPSECTMAAPRDDEAWLITYQNDPADGKPSIVIEKVGAGFGAGRVFHSAHLNGSGGVSVVGGMAGTQAVQNDKIMFFDIGSKAWRAAPEGGSAFVARGAHAGITTESRSILLVGGETNVSNLTGSTRALVELYTPSSIEIPTN